VALSGSAAALMSAAARRLADSLISNSGVSSSAARTFRSGVPVSGAGFADHSLRTIEIEVAPATSPPLSSRVAIGCTSRGRYLRVIYVPDPEPDSVFVITAYELRGKPLIAYRRRRRRKGKR
jgi:hypothetical protein